MQVHVKRDARAALLPQARDNSKRLCFRFTIIGTLTVSNHATNLSELSQSDARIILLYSTREEAINIMRMATAEGLTGETTWRTY